MIVATLTLTWMFETISAWIVSMTCLAALLSFSSFIFVIVTSENVIVVSHLLKLLLVRNLFKLFFLVPVRISTYVAVLLTFLFEWVASFLEWLLLHLIIVVKVLWRFMVIILWHLTHQNLWLLSHSWMSLIIRIVLVILWLRLSWLLRSVVWNSMLDLLLRVLWWLVLGLVLLWSWLLVLELRCHFLLSWNLWSHANNCWNLSFIFRRSLRSLRLTLVINIIIISISINALWRLRKIVIMAMRILIVSASPWLLWTELWVTLIELLSHRFVNGLGNCIFFWFFVVVAAHKIMIIHIFLNASRRMARIFDVALIDVLDLLNISFDHIEISCFELFCFL